MGNNDLFGLDVVLDNGGNLIEVGTPMEVYGGYI